MPIIKRTALAEEDLIEIWIYIAQDDPGAADHLLNEFEKKFSFLANNPKIGPARQDIAPELRYFPVGSYLILYRTIHDGIEIVRVVHGARRLTDLFS